MRRTLPLVLFTFLAGAALPAQAQLLKKLEEKLKAAVPGAAPARAPTPAPARADGSELPAPAPGAEGAGPGYLGLEGGTDKAGGVRVDAFKEAGKAKDSGLKVGDRIVAIDGAAVKDEDEFGAVMETKHAGDTIALTVVRDGKQQQIKVKLVDPPADALGPPAETPGVVSPPGAGGPFIVPRSPGGAARASLGISVITLTDELRERLGVPVRRGAVITTVRPGSPADRAGLPVDGVVVAMDGQMISNSDDLVQAIRAAKPGSDTELSYYVGDKLARKSVKLAPATVISTLPPAYGGERPLTLGPPGADRPLLSRVEKVVEGLTRPAGAAPVTDAADVAALQQSYNNMQAQMKLLVDRVDALEARLKSLEAAAEAPRPVDSDAPKLKLKEKAAPKLEAPAKP